MSERASARAPSPLLAMGLVAVAVAALVMASLSTRWLQSTLADLGVGLRTASLCAGDTCTRLTTDEYATQLARAEALAEDDAAACLDRSFEACDDATEIMACHDAAVARCAPSAGARQGVFVAAGWITSVALWLGALALVLAIALGVRARVGATALDLPIAPTTIAVLALGIALIAGCVFVAAKPIGTDDVGIGWAFWIFAGGEVAGLLGAIQLARALRPPVAAWDPDD